MLIADDDPDLRHVVASLLRKDGYDVVELASGAALLEYLASVLMAPRHMVAPSLIIVDVCMPGFSGLEVLAGLRRDWAVPIVVITALWDEGTRRTARNHGAAAFLRKPFKPVTLQGLVHGIVKVGS